MLCTPESPALIHQDFWHTSFCRWHTTNTLFKSSLPFEKTIKEEANMIKDSNDVTHSLQLASCSYTEVKDMCIAMYVHSFRIQPRIVCSTSSKLASHIASSIVALPTKKSRIQSILFNPFKNHVQLLDLTFHLYIQGNLRTPLLGCWDYQWTIIPCQAALCLRHFYNNTNVCVDGKHTKT